MGTCNENGRPHLRVMFFEGGEFGGSVVCMGEMITGLAALGCEIGLVLYYRRTGPVDLGSIDGVQFREFLDLTPKARPRPEIAVRRFGIPCPTGLGIRYFLVALRALRRFRPDIAYFNNEIEGSIPAAIAAKLLGIPTICHLRIARDQRRIEKVFARFYDQFVVLTKVGQQVVQASGIPMQKVRQIYDPFDVLAFSERIHEALFLEIPWEDDCVYVIQVGTLNNRKRPMLALDAFAYARMQCPNLRLIFAGSGPLHDALQQEISSRGLKGCVHLIRDCLQIPALLGHCDIGLFVSESEGTGLVILEFMAAGVPVVTWNMPVLEEVGVNDEIGIMVKQDNAENFGEALVKLCRSAALRKRLSHNGRNRVRQDSRFCPETHNRKILDVIMANVRNSKPSPLVNIMRWWAG